ncbi:unnamed protein product [Caenorhabditis angaria]|uniref:Uncharacterized protein n=1 Tax=Caenorhabditis angaria TaxID=860376 RepID=A0A9P1J1L3_9PELO|nr:unnamed protein product [Caenorhabditis angaria]
MMLVKFDRPSRSARDESKPKIMITKSNSENDLMRKISGASLRSLAAKPMLKEVKELPSDEENMDEDTPEMTFLDSEVTNDDDDLETEIPDVEEIGNDFFEAGPELDKEIEGSDELEPEILAVEEKKQAEDPGFLVEDQDVGGSLIVEDEKIHESKVTSTPDEKEEIHEIPYQQGNEEQVSLDLELEQKSESGSDQGSEKFEIPKSRRQIVLNKFRKAVIAIIRQNAGYSLEDSLIAQDDPDTVVTLLPTSKNKIDIFVTSF